jgi:hypothetical protein
MRWTGSLSLLAYLSVACLSTGCETSQSRAYSNDPLLQFWKPVEGKAKDSSPVLIAHAEPVIPELADRSALAEKNPDTQEKREPMRPTLDVAPRPTSRVVKAEPVSRKKEGTYNDLFGKGEDYRWLIGILEKNSEGRLILRYAPGSENHSSDDGTVLLNQDAFAAFQVGDVVFVEGDLAEPAQTEMASAPPYHTRSIKLLRKGSLSLKQN